MTDTKNTEVNFENQEENNEENTGTTETKEETVSLSKYMSLKNKLKAKEDEIEKLQSKSALTDEQQQALNEFLEERKALKIKQAFQNDFTKVKELYPEIADKENTIFKLAGLEENKDKSLEEIVLDTYGGLVKKTTVESKNQSGGAEKVDKYDFANLTPEQEKEVLSNPESKKAYFAWMDENQA